MQTVDCCSFAQTHNFTADIKFLDGGLLFHLETSSSCGCTNYSAHPLQCLPSRST